MYVPAQFEQREIAELHKVIRAYPLATWIVRDADDLIVNHVPMMLDPTRGEFGTLCGHVARANPVWRYCARSESKLIFHGPQSYISPSWYPSKRETGKVVPTWNYIVVHASGTAQVMEDPKSLLAHVSELSATQESVRAEPWHVTDAPQEYIDGLLRNIVGIEIPIRALTGKWKISQHRPLTESVAVVNALHEQSSTASHDIAQAMDAMVNRARTSS
jgi:transcriptional regulator